MKYYLKSNITVIELGYEPKKAKQKDDFIYFGGELIYYNLIDGVKMRFEFFTKITSNNPITSEVLISRNKSIKSN